MKFSDIYGHEELKQRLRAMADSENIPHALLLEGPEGVGKFALARAFAQYVHCTNRTPDGDSCGKCPSCIQHESFNHIDTIFSFPIIKRSSGSEAISDDYIAEFRDFIAENPYMDFDKWLQALDNTNAQPKIFVSEAQELSRKLNFTTHQAKYKIVLIWLAERMNEDAANKLLKLLEEPFPDTLFVITTDNARLLLPTIYSRTQRVITKRLDDSVIADHLVANFNVAPDEANAIARLSDGSINKAEGMLNLSQDRKKFLEAFIKLMRDAYQRKIFDMKQWSIDMASMGRERLMQFYDYCCRMIRENFILNLHDPELNFMSGDEMSFSQRFAPFINEKNVEQLINVFTSAKTDISGNCNAKIVNFDVAIKVILLLKQN